MITPETFFICTCDNCGVSYGNEDSNYIVLPDESSMSSVLREDDEWHTMTVKDGPDKHYCPECFLFDDLDQLVIKTIPEEDKTI